jgi:cytochrome c biogenesis protein CcmG/thiol:disulfide interchange protein DsbE
MIYDGLRGTQFATARGTSQMASTPDSTPSDANSVGNRNSSGLATVLIFVAAGIVVALVFEMSSTEDRDVGTHHPAVGRRLPHLDLKPLTGEGKPVSLGDLEGRVTLIDFWGTWCPPCREEFPHIAALAAHFRNRPDFQVLAVSCGGGEEDFNVIADETRAFLESYKIDLPTYKDPGGYSRRGIDMVSGFQGYPTTLVLDRQGIIRGLWFGYRRGYEQQIEKLVAELLTGM